MAPRKANRDASENSPASDESFQPFPVEALPEPLRGILTRAAVAFGCDASFVALPVLSVCSAAIGNSRVLRMKDGWDVPPILWTALVAESGSMKSPPIGFAKRPLERLQDRELARYTKANAESEKPEQTKSQTKSTAKPNDSKPPVKRAAAPLRRFYCDDATVEAAVSLLAQNPRGLIVVRDELSGLLGSFDRYSQSRGGDVARWIEMFDCRSMMVDRKTGDQRTTAVRRAAMAVTGSIQPGILRRTISGQNTENGLAARFLFAFPPHRIKVWTEESISPLDERTYECVIEKLHRIPMVKALGGPPSPGVVRLSSDARSEWAGFFNQHNRASAKLTGGLAAAWSKLEQYAARLALVIHCIRYAGDDSTLVNFASLDADSMKAGIGLANWFANEAMRVYAMLGESDGDRTNRKLIDFIKAKGGSVSARDVQRGLGLKSVDDAERLLNGLRVSGLGEWTETTTGKQGGRPTRRFALFDETGEVHHDGTGFVNNEEATDLGDLGEGLDRSDDDEPKDLAG